ncbi:unnamed protein product, partial [Closterium sp. NIES-54]
DVKQLCQSLPDRRWDKRNRAWTFPIDIAADVERALRALPHVHVEAVTPLLQSAAHDIPPCAVAAGGTDAPTHMPHMPSHVPNPPPHMPHMPSHVPNPPTHMPHMPSHVPNPPPHMPHMPSHVPNPPTHMPHMPSHMPNPPTHMPHMPSHVPNPPPHMP